MCLAGEGLTLIRQSDNKDGGELREKITRRWCVPTLYWCVYLELYIVYLFSQISQSYKHKNKKSRSLIYGIPHELVYLLEYWIIFRHAIKTHHNMIFVVRPLYLKLNGEFLLFKNRPIIMLGIILKRLDGHSLYYNQSDDDRAVDHEEYSLWSAL